MKQTLTSAAVLALLLGAGALATSANAADLRGGGYKDENPGNPGYLEETPSHHFVGLAVGIHGGMQFTNINIDDQFDGIGADGFAGGVHAEYLINLGGRLRVGPYIEGGLSNVNVEFQGDDIIEQKHYYGGGIKAGVTAFGASLIYARLGYERALWEAGFGGGNSTDVDVDSLVAGVGIATMIREHVSFGLGIDYVAPLSIEADGQDINELEDSEGLRGMARITYHH